MSHDDLSAFSGRAPLFPLPNVILFPQTVLPLHIFEPRYRAMTRDALQGERLIAMALLKPGWEPDGLGRPAIYGTVGLGRIVQDQKMQDGRFNILLYGVRRARVTDEELTEDAYRMASLELLEEDPPEDPRFEQIRLGLLAIYSSLVGKALKQAPKPPPAMSLGLLCDLLTAAVDTDVSTKQSVFEELDVAARAGKVIDLLKKTPVGGMAVASGLKPTRRWPPEAGVN